MLRNRLLSTVCFAPNDDAAGGVKVTIDNPAAGAEVSAAAAEQSAEAAAEAARLLAAQVEENAAREIREHENNVASLQGEVSLLKSQMTEIQGALSTLQTTLISSMEAAVALAVTGALAAQSTLPQALQEASIETEASPGNAAENQDQQTKAPQKRRILI